MVESIRLTIILAIGVGRDGTEKKKKLPLYAYVLLWYACISFHDAGSANEAGDILSSRIE